MIYRSNRLFAPRALSIATGLATVLILSCIAPVQTFAASSAWSETEGGRIRITALEPSEDGSIRAVLDVDLLPGWKTYWRDPGEAGVPPSLEFDGSTNIKDAVIHFPAPERIKDDYSTWAGYTYPVAFPLTLSQDNAGTASTLEANVFLGLCQSICIPFQTSFVVTIDPKTPANAFEKRLVHKAFMALPEQPGKGFDIVSAALDKDDARLTLAIALPDGAKEAELFVTGPAGWYFETPRLISQTNNIATFDSAIDVSEDAAPLSVNGIRVLVKASGRSMETELSHP
ncbi:MAG: protein-disulfide reductase DsbD family protein [Rhizobiaceae bacterium]|nr:protein-disulfide reductase DsbD family protein [Rhizobiaceae bacterium]